MSQNPKYDASLKGRRKELVAMRAESRERHRALVIAIASLYGYIVKDKPDQELFPWQSPDHCIRVGRYELLKSSFSAAGPPKEVWSWVTKFRAPPNEWKKMYLMLSEKLK